MGDDEKGQTSAWYKVPTWDGSPATWRGFRREMSWWISSLNIEDTKKYNLAARWLLRQTGSVRARGEEFLPEEFHFSVPSYVDSIDGLSFDASFLEGSLDRFCEVPEETKKNSHVLPAQVVPSFLIHFDDFC